MTTIAMLLGLVTAFAITLRLGAPKSRAPVTKD